MPTRYVWFDDKRKDPPTRMELRPPKSLHDFTAEVAERNGVSVNAFVVALLEWAYTADHERRLVLDFTASRVRVTTKTPARSTSRLPSHSEPSENARLTKGKKSDNA
jgi:hypothetical protein